MLLKYKETEYNNKIEYLRNNGYTVNNVALDYEDFTTDVENQTLFAQFQLPNGGKSYKDYSAIVAWSNYLENDDASVERSYSGMPVPITFTADNNGNPVICSYVFEDTATEGIVRLTITITGTMEHTDADFKYYIDNLRGLMFIEGDECTLDPDVSLVVPNLEAFFAQVNATQTFQLDLTTKTRLLSLGDDEGCCVDSAYKCYKIVPRNPSIKTSDVLFDGTYYYTENSSFQLRELPRGTVINLTGYTAEELAVTAEATIYETAKSNSQIFKTTVTNYSPGCLYLSKDLIYPISESLFLNSNLRIEGNGSTIMAYDMKEHSDGTFERREMSVISNTLDGDPVSNVNFENLTFRGRFDGSNVGLNDQCLKTLTEYNSFSDFTFVNVKFDGFMYAVHTGSETETLPTENFNWLFDNCEFVNVETGFMISWSRGITVINSHIDDFLCKNDKHHCVYIARGSSYISFDNCLLENSIGCGIDVSEATAAEERKKMHHCTFSNLQIRNCCIGVNVSSPSEYITVKNIIVTNAARALRLANCTNVIIDNFNATGCFYYEYIRPGEEEDTHWGNSSSEWVAIAIHGYVEAKITNSFFSTGGALFSSAISGLMSQNYDYRVVTTSLEFKNCVFITTFSEYMLGNDGETYYQPGANLGVNKITTENGNIKEFYYYHVDFNDCQFYMNSENNEDSMIKLYGYEEHPSIYNFNNCLIAYRDGNGNPNHDKELLYNDDGSLKTIEKQEEQIVSMPRSYFIHPDVGTHAYITNCSFYNNRDVFPDDSDEGFVKRSFLNTHMTCTVDEKTKYDQKLVIVDSTSSQANN